MGGREGERAGAAEMRLQRIFKHPFLVDTKRLLA